MLVETEWPGDAIAAPICLTCDREDALSQNRVDDHSDQTDADPTAVVLEDWRDAVIKPAPGVQRRARSDNCRAPGRSIARLSRNRRRKLRRQAEVGASAG